MNSKNVEDLDSLYFYDKVKVRSSSVSNIKVPALNLGGESEEAKQKKTSNEKSSLVKR